MNTTLYLVRNTVSLTSHWEPTGDPRMPLARVWTEAKTPQTDNAASSTDEPGGSSCAPNGNLNSTAPSRPHRA